MENLIGRTLQNRFKVLSYVASGGMSVVYRVWDVQRNVTLAMKVLHLDLMDDLKALKGFQREAKALQRLAHPNIVPFYGLYQEEDLYFLLELFVDGPSLKDILRKRKGKLSLPEVLIIFKALCAALGYAHANGVVHCDVKPGNVMIDRSGQVFLTDFGVARHAESTTTTIGAAGTPAYMAPEQIRGEPVSAATDVYALGVLLYEMLTGYRPFTGAETDSESSGATAGERVRMAHLTQPAPDPRQLNPDIAPGLSAVVLKAMEKAPQQRYQNAQQFFDVVCKEFTIDRNTIPDRLSENDFENYAREPNPIVPTGMRNVPGIIVQTTQPEYILADVSLAEISTKRNSRRKVIYIGLLLLVVTGLLFLVTAGLLAGAFTLISGSDFNIELSDRQKDLTETQNAFLALLDTAVPTTFADPVPPTIAQPGDKWRSPFDGMLLVYIPAGEFQMGSKDGADDEHPIHTVYLDAFWMDTTEITNLQYSLCVSAGECNAPSEIRSNSRPSYFNDPDYADYPVIYISWDDANNYCVWAERKLPDEAQWEKAARAGWEGVDYPWGSEQPTCQLGEVNGANFWDCLGDDTMQVRSFAPNRYGLYDMTGNVWEWVWDWYDEDFYQNSPDNNPTGPAIGEYRVVRGGSWYYTSWYLRNAYRTGAPPLNRDSNLGFRCAR